MAKSAYSVKHEDEKECQGNGLFRYHFHELIMVKKYDHQYNYLRVDKAQLHIGEIQNGVNFVENIRKMHNQLNA